jgi:hypothetical protein
VFDLPYSSLHSSGFHQGSYFTILLRLVRKAIQIIIYAGAYREFGMLQDNLDARFGQNVGIEDFENKDEHSGMNFYQLKYTISDHRPVWAKFRINLGDDD